MKSTIFSVVAALSLTVLPYAYGDALASQNANHKAPPKQERVLHGNYSSGIYHNAYCRHYNCKKCTVVFKSSKEARENGYRACKKCGG